MRNFLRMVYFKPIGVLLVLFLILQFVFIDYLPCTEGYIAYADEISSQKSINGELKSNDDIELAKQEEILDDNITEDKYNIKRVSFKNSELQNEESKDDSDNGEEVVPPEIEEEENFLVPSITSFGEDMGKNNEKLVVIPMISNNINEYVFTVLAKDTLNVCKRSAKNDSLAKWFAPKIKLENNNEPIVYSYDGKNFSEKALISSEVEYYMSANITGAPSYIEKERDSLIYFKKKDKSNDKAIKVKIHYIPAISNNGGSNSGNNNGNDSNNNSNNGEIIKSVSIYGTERVQSTLRAKVKYNDNVNKPKISYQWLKCKDKDGDYKEIDKATDDEYKIKSNDKGYYIKVRVSISSNSNDSKLSERSEIIKEKLKDNSSSSNSGSNFDDFKDFDSGISIDKDKTSEDEMYLNTSYSSEVDKDIFSLTKECEYERLILEGSNYVWNFKTSDLKNLSQMDEKFNSEIKTNVKNSSEVVINFKHKGVLPGKATVQVNVGEELNGDNRYLYYYNEANNSLELISSNVSVKKGKAIFSITHCSKYILSTTPNNGSNVSNIVSNDYNEDDEITIGGNFVNNIVNSDGGASSNGINFNNGNSLGLRWKESRDGKWYLCGDSCIMTGWQKVEGNWYYFDDFGVMQKDWVNSNGKWYYLSDDGVLTTGWVKSKGNWHYLNSNGEMVTGWKVFDDIWYYFNEYGEMQTGWQYVEYRWYYLYPDGAMAYDVEIDGRMLNQNGAAR
ncbi:N-acetylmuramoyl-L-alanine amidase family protein [Clostridium botulinum]|nr:N-acetylmuramoyl-L-alanine amidase family protein [Clostridium botulinum]